jgi:isochorismate hydrolase
MTVRFMQFEKLNIDQKIRARINDDVLYCGIYLAHTDRFIKVRTDEGYEVVFDAFMLQIDIQQDEEWIHIGSLSNS